MRAPETGTLVGVRLQADDLTTLDGWRRQQDDLPSRPEAIRRLTAFALALAPHFEEVKGVIGDAISTDEGDLIDPAHRALLDALVEANEAVRSS
ncbi:MAG: hypothetical protein K0S56_344 [Microvirga sp.]|jgi:hypothetical protein|nr:hypothetical protein [Microvirga sp.]